MDYFIRIENGQPVEHPVAADNFAMAFSGTNPNDPSSGFARFTRVPQPDLGPYDTGFTHSYAWQGDVVVDVWTPIPMSAEQRAAKIELMQKFKFGKNWTFDETNCIWVPPVPKPEGDYVWDDTTETWINFGV